MSLPSPSLQPTLTTLSSFIALLAIGGGISSLISPSAFAASNGLPAPPPSGSPFVRLAGARNLSSGITILTLLYTGQRKAVGTLLMCGTVAGLTDAWIISGFGKGKAWGHAVMAGVLGGWGLVMVRSS